MKNIEQLLAWACMAFGALIIIMIRVSSVELTEGETLVEHWMLWLAAISSIALGVVVICKSGE